jgi:hypothetical protein
VVAPTSKSEAVSPTGYSGAWCSWLFRQFHCFSKRLAFRGNQYFTNNYLVSHLVPVVAAALVLKALLDSAEGNTPIPSLVSALLVLSVQALWTMANSWNLSSDQYGVADGLMNLVNWAGSNVCPAVGALCVIGAVVNFVRGKPWGHLAITSIAMMCFSGIWLLVKSWG